MAYRYGMTPSDVLSDGAGNVLSGWRLDFYDAETGGTRITDLEDLAGNPLPGYVTTDSEGRFRFRRVDESLAILWADDGQDAERWAVVAAEATIAAAGAAADADAAAASAADAAASAQAAEASASQATTDAQQATTTANDALAEIDAYKVQTPTLEELMFSVYFAAVNFNGTLFPDTTGAGSLAVPVFAAPVAMVVQSVSMSWSYLDLAASDTDYWAVELERKIAADGTVQSVATRTTQVTGTNANGGITQKTAWTFSGVDLTAVTFSSGDVLSFRVNKTGTPPEMEFGVAVTVRYAPA